MRIFFSFFVVFQVLDAGLTYIGIRAGLCLATVLTVFVVARTGLFFLAGYL